MMMLLLTLMQVLPLHSLRQKDLTNSSEVLSFGLPRNCRKTQDYEHCCACGRVQDPEDVSAKDRKALLKREWGRSDDDLCFWSNHPERSVLNRENICCPQWATECEVDDAYYKYRLEQDCLPDLQDCQLKECKAVTERLASAKEWLNRAQTKLKESKKSTWKIRYVTGQSNHGERCKCVCGELQNETKMECKRNRKGFSTCPNLRPCCTKLEDCAAEAGAGHAAWRRARRHRSSESEDPWPRQVKEEYQKKTAEAKASMKELQDQVDHLRFLQKDCVKSCGRARSYVYLYHLKSVKKKKTFRKDITWQEAIEMDRFENHRAKGKSAKWEAEKKFLDDGRQWMRRSHQLVKMPPSHETGPDLPFGFDCCACGQPLMWGEFDVPAGDPLPMATRFCKARIECSAFRGATRGGACTSVPLAFCTKSVLKCPDQLGFFTRPVWYSNV
ncbi:unnamed protein product [Durusdinium trenchii]|uniref:Uncharacterized protein n=1 Tax=Durusdinium trenchii TaxID=1381693 RepID=A0ABP0HJ52_9DINO